MRSADEEYHRLTSRLEAVLLEIARLEALHEELEDKLDWLDEKYVIDKNYCRRLWEEGL